MIDAPILDDQLTVMVGARLPETICIAAARPIDSGGKPGIVNDRTGCLPAADHKVKEAIDVSAVGLSAAYRQSIDPNGIKAMANILSCRTIVGRRIIPILIRSIGP